jgi:hypothetical protein
MSEQMTVFRVKCDDEWNEGCLNALFPIGYPDANTCSDTHEENYGVGHFVTMMPEVVSVDMPDIDEVTQILHEYRDKFPDMFNGKPRVRIVALRDETLRAISNVVRTDRGGNPYVNLLQGHRFLVREDIRGILVLGKIVG